MSIKITEIREKIAEFLHGDRDYDQHDMARDAAEALDYWRATYVREHQRVDLADTKAVAASVACGMLRARAEKAEAEVARVRGLWESSESRLADCESSLMQSQAEVARLRAALVEVMEYEGGSESPLEDQYLVDRIRAALEPTR